MKTPTKKTWAPGTMQLAFFIRYPSSEKHPNDDAVIEFTSTKPIEMDSVLATAARIVATACFGENNAIWKIAARGFWVRLLPDDVLDILHASNLYEIAGDVGTEWARRGRGQAASTAST